ncbi:MAG: hypothetical protein ACNS62_18870 [Candidatus Cyclobacteriaceae bacterium M3_2C_046]
MADKKDIVQKIITYYGQSFWFCGANLFSARISSDISVIATKNLKKQGWTTAKNMMDSTWNQRVKTLNDANYTRYQERTSNFLGEVSRKLNDTYQGDLRKLREAANRDPFEIRKLLKEFKGVGDVGVDIFYREVQTTWNELYPFADKKALKSTHKAGLYPEAKRLSDLTKSKKDFLKLVPGLVRMDLNNDYKLEKVISGQENKQDLSSRSKQELYEKARQQNISGRSKMSKKELQKALSYKL